VAIADVDQNRAEAAAAELSAAGSRVAAVGGDVRSAADIEAMVATPVAAFGGLDVLVTVVGGQVAFVPAVRLHEMDDADWDLVYEVSAMSLVRPPRRSEPSLARAMAARS
jgi:3-oxoacyl-[acyl-carrier protein] reductase